MKINGHPHTSNLPTLMTHNFRLEMAIEIWLVVSIDATGKVQNYVFYRYGSWIGCAQIRSRVMNVINDMYL